MNLKNKIITSESVSEGHPDKMCDRISDRIVDFLISGDKNSRIAVETMASHKNIFISGEVSSNSKFNEDDIKKLAIEVIKETGYSYKWGYDPQKINIHVDIEKQSENIARGVDIGGAGDQGIMFGYACDDTPEFMPAATIIAHALLIKLSELRKSGSIKYVGPDAKSQVSVYYNSDGKPELITSIVISTQHSEDVVENGIVSEKFKEEIKEKVILPVCGNMITNETNIKINPTGLFIKGGPIADTGLTGRKIIVDTYGGYAPHGGGAFSGKDPTKVDRSAAYMARYIAKNLVASNICKRCLIQIAYAIGIAEPVSLMVDTYGTSKYSDEDITKIIRGNFDLTPKGIIKELNLLQPIYFETAAYGHFGRNIFSWEKLKENIRVNV